MFKVKNVRTGEIRIVYAVCGIMFLFYDGISWVCDYMDQYEPIERKLEESGQ